MAQNSSAMNGKEVSHGAESRNGKATLEYNRKRAKGVKDMVRRRITNASTSSNDFGSDYGVEKQEIPFLPLEIIIKILIFLPADILHTVMRLVCRQWYKIISHPRFIRAHLHQSATGVLVETKVKASQGRKSAYFLKIQEAEIIGQRMRRKQVRESYGNPLAVLPLECSQTILDCCDGLLLVVNTNIRSTVQPYRFSIVNPSTKQNLPLSPPYDPAVGFHTRCATICASLSRNMYSVVLTGMSENTLPPQSKCWVFISTINGGQINSNTWRCIPLGRFYPSCTTSVGGFVYWHLYQKPIMVALDVETERIYRVKAPDNVVLKEGYSFTKYIKSERFLIMPVNPRPWIWEFWALVDTRNSGWRKLYDIVDLRSMVPLVEGFIGGCSSLEPLFVVSKEDLIIFQVYSADFLIGYRVKSRSIFRFGKYDPVATRGRIFGHVQSLLSLKDNSSCQ